MHATTKVELTFKGFLLETSSSNLILPTALVVLLALPVINTANIVFFFLGVITFCIHAYFRFLPLSLYISLPLFSFESYSAYLNDNYVEDTTLIALKYCALYLTMFVRLAPEHYAIFPHLNVIERK